ncbi:LysR family transcriptional regulator [Novosphingobium bradum]|uniref:LysR family transcriptional regulator n=1 Tax=Novosphingobium bradum TaxID=1737444 RepID=A0ABV7IM28_9SPHN
MTPLDWDDLRLFLAIARAGRLVGAGRALGLDHTTVARRLGALEGAVGARLFERNPRGVTLTDAGHLLVDHAERIEGEVAAAANHLSGTDARVSGAVRLATPEAFGTWLVAPEVHRLHAAHPELRLELAPEPQLVSLAKREADVAVLLNRPQAGPIIARRLTEYRLGLYAARRYVETAGPITAERLSDHPFAGYIDDRIDAPELRFLGEVAADARPVFRSTSIAAQHAAVAGGLGLGVLHVFAADADPALVRLLPDQIEIRRAYWLAIHADQQRLPRVRAVVDFLDAVVNEARERF